MECALGALAFVHFFIQTSILFLIFLNLFCFFSFDGFSFIYNSSAQVPTTSLEGRLEFGDKRPFNITTRITLNNGEYTTYSRVDGSFIMFEVPPGIHQLDIHSPTYHFGQVKIQLLEEAMDAPKCLEYAYPGAMKQVLSYPLVLYPHATYEYFEKRRGFSIFSLLKNPMVLMMIFSGGLMFLMPKLMEGMDPEERAQMKKQMEAQQNPTQMFSQMLGDFTGNPAQDPKEARRARRQNRVKKD